MSPRRLVAMLALTVGGVLAGLTSLGRGDVRMVFFGGMLLMTTGGILFLTPDPEQTDKALRSGAPPEVIEQQVEQLRKKRKTLWICLGILAFAAVVTFAVR